MTNPKQEDKCPHCPVGVMAKPYTWHGIKLRKCQSCGRSRKVEE
jgi:hypothetical protein